MDKQNQREEKDAIDRVFKKYDKSLRALSENGETHRKERFIEFMAYLIVGTGVGIIVLTAVALVARFVLIPIFN